MSKGDYHIQRRLEHQIHLLLEEMENEPALFDFKIRLTVIEKVGMYLTRQLKLGDEGESIAGSTVRKYSSAFKTNVAGRSSNNVAGRRTGQARSTPALAFDNTADDDEPAAD